MMSCFVRFRLLAVALFVCGFASVVSAQSDSHSVGVEPIHPQHGISLGVEFGYGADYQQGSFPSSGFFDNGSGYGFMGSLFAELPISRHFSIGLQAGLYFKNTAGARQRNDTVIVVEQNIQADTIGPFPLNIKSTVNLSSLIIAPQLYFRPFETGLFLRLAPAISLLLSSNETLSRNLVTTPNGSERFRNGTTTEEIIDGPITDVNTLQLSALFSMGYDFDLGNITIAPIVTYDYPFTTVRNTNENNWKIASLYGSVAIQFKL